ncbi:hypothetical protein RAA17_00785 [Komagataeibacter rhaeticus]|nr:hypothetical protein [Komagataeibacter rhaeticus]
MRRPAMLARSMAGVARRGTRNVSSPAAISGAEYRACPVHHATPSPFLPPAPAGAGARDMTEPGAGVFQHVLADTRTFLSYYRKTVQAGGV